ncbi:MAG: hypothetical protein HYU52_16605 [Acidobacteria bacterium]|nr:hypothetical protein [Acidobacteriota bacterium]
MRIMLTALFVCLALCFASDLAACIPDSKTLCLNNERFQIRVDWKTPQGQNGTGNAVRVRNASNQFVDDSGYFWFFNQDNVELVVKVLNGCPVNNRYWVFAGGLTNVEATITVTDTFAGFEQKTYKNPLNTAFQPIQDTSAFATCP